MRKPSKGGGAAARRSVPLLGPLKAVEAVAHLLHPLAYLPEFQAGAIAQPLAIRHHEIEQLAVLFRLVRGFDQSDRLHQF